MDSTTAEPLVTAWADCRRDEDTAARLEGPAQPAAGPPSRYFRVKPALDFVAALVLLVPALPVMLAAALLVKVTSRGPAFYCQRRLGRQGREFTLVKIRTMIDGAEDETGPVWAKAEDPRVTSVGWFLRLTHLDELPQLFNVLRGHMSLVGPRPERPELIPELAWQLPGYHDRLQVRPGITGIAQLRQPPDGTIECVRRKLCYDLYYVQSANPWLDLRIVAITSIRWLRDCLLAAWMVVDVPHWEAVRRRVPPVDVRRGIRAAGPEGSPRRGNGECSEHTPEPDIFPLVEPAPMASAASRANGNGGPHRGNGDHSEAEQRSSTPAAPAKG
ncbi:MAG TPA: sugar transferase [Planctomycetaceae bacterium]|nr:sugar transferase [Planctomycetaceae bacterium]